MASWSGLIGGRVDSMSTRQLVRWNIGLRGRGTESEWEKVRLMIEILHYP